MTAVLKHYHAGTRRFIYAVTTERERAEAALPVGIGRVTECVDVRCAAEHAAEIMHGCAACAEADGRPACPRHEPFFWAERGELTFGTRARGDRPDPNAREMLDEETGVWYTERSEV